MIIHVSMYTYIYIFRQSSGSSSLETYTSPGRGLAKEQRPSGRLYRVWLPKSVPSPKSKGSTSRTCAKNGAETPFKADSKFDQRMANPF